ARRGYLRYAAYPAATAAGAFTNIIFGLMRGSVLLALFAERERIGAYDAAATITYVWVTQGLLNVVALWGWQELALRVRSGDIATDLIRPIHPIRAGLATDYGRALYQLIFRGIPPVAVGALAFGAVLPADPFVWLAFFASLALAVAVSFGFRLLYNLAAFWTTDTRGAMILALVVMSVFSGFTIPIQFFPPWLAVIANVQQLAQWTLPEVALLYAISGLAFAFTDLAIGHLDEFPRLIRDGNFDLLLVRPRATLFQLLSADFQVRRLGKAVGALAVLAYALANLRIDWDIGRVAMLLLVVPVGVVIFASIWVTTICIAFWSVEAREASNAFTYGGQFLSQFPINVYDQWLRRFLAYIFPIAFVAYFPALYILGKPDPIGLPEWLRFVSP